MSLSPTPIWLTTQSKAEAVAAGEPTQARGEVQASQLLDTAVDLFVELSDMRKLKIFAGGPAGGKASACNADRASGPGQTLFLWDIERLRRTGHLAGGLSHLQAGSGTWFWRV